jgi:hypothetical protein
MAIARIPQRRWLGFAGGAWAGEGVSGGGTPGAAHGLNSPGRILGARATRGDACTGRTRAAVAESGWDTT